jgi:hypothetical protein
MASVCCAESCRAVGGASGTDVLGSALGPIGVERWMAHQLDLGLIQCSQSTFAGLKQEKQESCAMSCIGRISGVVDGS